MYCMLPGAQERFRRYIWYLWPTAIPTKLASELYLATDRPVHPPGGAARAGYHVIRLEDHVIRILGAGGRERRLRNKVTDKLTLDLHVSMPWGPTWQA